MPLRILLAEDHLIVRQGVKQLLTREGYSVVAEAADGREAVRLAREHCPDIAVLDLGMPRSSTAMSGQCSRARRTASRPSAASATTLYPSRVRSCFTPCLTIRWSSANRIRSGISVRSEERRVGK